MESIDNTFVGDEEGSEVNHSSNAYTYQNDRLSNVVVCDRGP